MTNEEKARAIISEDCKKENCLECGGRYSAEKGGCVTYQKIMQMARWKDEIIKNFKHHADEMYYAMENLSTDGSQVRKAMEDYQNFLFTEYYNN